MSTYTSPCEISSRFLLEGGTWQSLLLRWTLAGTFPPWWKFGFERKAHSCLWHQTCRAFWEGFDFGNCWKYHVQIIATIHQRYILHLIWLRLFLLYVILMDHISARNFALMWHMTGIGYTSKEYIQKIILIQKVQSLSMLDVNNTFKKK